MLVLVYLTATAIRADNVLQDAPDVLNDERWADLRAVLGVILIASCIFSDFAKLKKAGTKAGKEIVDKAMDLFGLNKLGFGSAAGIGLKVGMKPTPSKNTPVYFKGGKVT